ncbi:c-type cytochrome [Comamonas sp.]|uniref:c-type cytochrome n=1 Tax=Comamonas sp. TaxID=34028 RepID=UPI002898D451|nr:c-type cytochrome [Comamonas sp.]
MSDTHHEEGHTGPIKNSKQLLITVVLAFILPVILIIGLVNFVGSAPKTGAGVGMHELAQAQRIQKIGSIEIRDADRPLRGGEDVYKGQCAACHATGVSGAPKFGEAAEWGPRLGQGFEALVHSALKGKGAMAPQGGGEFNDLEISRAVAFMANSGGANFPEPQPEAKEGDAK